MTIEDPYTLFTAQNPYVQAKKKKFSEKYPQLEHAPLKDFPHFS